MQICPICASRCIYFSKKKNCYGCEDCNNFFDTPLIESGYRIFISYGHDDNQALVTKIKEYLLSKGYEVWIDSSAIKKGSDWREKIVDGLIASNGVLAFLSEHSVRNPGVCLDELRIALRLKHAFVKSILLESEEITHPPYHLSEGQWVDMKDWKEVPEKEWDDYFHQKMDELIEALESDEAIELEEQLKFIGSKLAVNEQIGKEQSLLKEEFIGRKWLTEQVQDWLENSNNNRMMILGVPGSGKSAFSANFSEYSVDVIGTIYFSYDNDYLKNIDRVICYLAYKLALNIADYRKILYSLLKEKSKALSDLHDTGLFEFLILNPLYLSVNTSRENHLLIFDGLDETSEEVAKFIFNKARQLPSWIKSLFTTRYDETSLSIYSNAYTLVLDQNEERNKEDIKEYVSTRLNLDKDSQEMKVLLDRFDGSFMYAKAFVLAVLGQQISLNDINSIPRGINEFYLEFFNRLFPSYTDFIKARPFFEILCVDETIINPILYYALELDKDSLWELRHSLKSLIITEKAQNEMRTLKFIHKSIYDWIQNKELANQYYIDKKNGYKTLFQTYLRLIKDRKGVILDKYVFEEDKKGVKEINKCIQSFKDDNIKWLFKAGYYKEYKKVLLACFNKDKIDVSDYLYYYRFINLWKWADFFPKEEDVSALINKLIEIVTYPASRMVSSFAHRGLEICASLLAELIQTPRYKEVFFKFTERTVSGYFMSAASDLDGETRGGWDKYYYTLYINICLKKLEKLNVDIPMNVKKECERCKLTFNAFDGDPKEGMFMERNREDNSPYVYGLLCHKDFYKDICTYEPENEMFKELKIDYNTTALRYYFIYGDDEDNEYVNRCVEELANIKEAGMFALDYLVKKGYSQRLEYVKKVMNNL